MENKIIDKYQDFSAEIPFSYAKHSTIGCGGNAPIAFYPQSNLEMVDLLSRLNQDGISYRVLGNLSNVLPPDETGKDFVVSTKRMQDFSSEKVFYVSAGVSCGTLMRICSLIGKSGMEFMAGIPCTVGGALYMNAGAGGRYIAECVESVRVVYHGKQEILSLKECEYAYKSSVFMRDKFVILGANFALTQSSGEQVKENINLRIQERGKLPKGKSMGCIFKNVGARSAGELIEKTGLKGMRVGGAVVSKEHANFIINEYNAKSADIKTLIDLIKNAVLAQYNIKLEKEIEYLE